MDEGVELVGEDGVGRRGRFLRIGEVFVTRDPHIITTILGSCVAVCLWDQRQRLGGMNHVATPEEAFAKGHATRAARAAVEDLVKRMKALGSKGGDLHAALLGGGNVIQLDRPLMNIGQQNVLKVEEAMAEQGLGVACKFAEKDYGLKVRFDTYDGTVDIWKVASLQEADSRLKRGEGPGGTKSRLVKRTTLCRG